MNVRFFKSLSLFIFFVKGVILVVQAGKGNYGNIYKKNNINIFNCMKRKYDKKLSSSVVNTNDKALYESSILKYYYLLDKYKKPNRKKIYGYINNVSPFPLEEERRRKKLEHMNKRNIYPCYNYDAKDIVILEGLEAVRKRPGMYIGNTDVKGLHQILFEIIDNSVDEYNNFECNTIKVVIHKDDSVTIEDNGRGIPCDVHEKTKKSALETVLTVLHSGAKFFDDEMDDEIDNNMNNTGNTNTCEKNNSDNISNNNNKKKTKKNSKESVQKYKYSSGLHGVGLSVANALSSFMKVKVFRNNKIYSIELEKGKVTKELTITDCPINKRGTQIHYKPDSSIFKSSTKHNSDLIKNRIHQLAYLNEKLTFYFYDERSENKNSIYISKGNKSNEIIKNKKKNTSIDNENEDNKNNSSNDDVSSENENMSDNLVNKNIEITDYNNLDFYNYEIIKHECGLNEYITNITKNKTNLFKENDKIISISCYHKNIYIDLRMKWLSNQYNENIISFVNNVNTTDGGTHVDALKYAVSRCVNYNIKKNEMIKNFVNIPGEYIREGLTAILSVKMNNPEFEGQTKTKLGSHHLKSILESVIFEKLSEIFDFEPNLLSSIYFKALQAKLSDEEAKAARDLIRSKNNQYSSTILPGKLVDCISDDISRNEIFIVEGDSAAGSAKQARNREIQAILPLKGKILNVEKIKNNKRIFENTELKSLITALGLNVNYDNKNLKNNNILSNNKKGKNSKKKSDLKNSRFESTQNNNNMLNKKKDIFVDNTLRYGKVIIMTDADVDGEHIRILLLTFLYRFQKEIIENGNVYVACPPLYKITYNKFFDNSIKDIVTKQFNVTTKQSKFIIHTYSDQELNNLLKLLDKDKISSGQKNMQNKIKNINMSSSDEPLSEYNEQSKNNDIFVNEEGSTDSFIDDNVLFNFSKKYEIQRFKGLGEMMADQLWNTTMDPTVRKLIRVTVNDAIRANDLIFSLMGEDSKLRKNFILENTNSLSE
ncbi:DNA gyrase subunit B, putative [Plasmodium reichenowi]|uniref:DNA topoisomerase 2 n=1 Tax=Plasmodium reichenowi TaxID=5854 RepID=A0A2P9DK25_PLARE|nr:DNA gyrase subunit B, putative [Plasmodium reichenowi]